MNIFTFVLVILHFVISVSEVLGCVLSKTTISGTFTPRKILCSGDLIFEDNFDKLNFKRWEHENTLAGGGNWEFQWYTNNRSNSYVENGILHIKPTLTVNTFNERFLYSGILDLHGGDPANHCTNPAYWGCSRTGNRINIINPIKSARIRTANSFSFCFGHVEVRAKLPLGDWLWPAIWLMPHENAYGNRWPTSGEIDLLEARGNAKLTQNGKQIGIKRVGNTLHWGPDYYTNKYNLTTWHKYNDMGFNEDFHVYEMIWSLDNITFLVDGDISGNISPPEGGFWELGKFEEMGYSNPWIRSTKMAPFDQEFYLIINLAVGGITYFPDDAANVPQKPWKNNSTKAATEFWQAREDWLPSWNLDESDDAAFQIDYVRIYAL